MPINVFYLILVITIINLTCVIMVRQDDEKTIGDICLGGKVVC